jgi:penicillin G amidase
MTPGGGEPRARLRGEDGAVVVDDADGTPTVRAESLRDATFGLGWCVGRQRRDQMDFVRRRVRGELAEVRGPEATADDLRQRTLGLHRVAEQTVQALPPDQRELAAAFARGVNLATGDDDRYPAWTEADCVSAAQFLAQAMSSDGAEHRMVEVLRRTLPDDVVRFLLPATDLHETALDGTAGVDDPSAEPVPVASLRALLEEPPGPATRRVVGEAATAGSNIWAVGPGPGSGEAVLASDLHLPLTDPALWYHAVLSLPEGRVAGATLPGLPLLVVGATESVAWSFTRLLADTVDLHEVEVDEQQGAYRAGDGWRPLRVRRETVAVRGAEPVEHVVAGTEHGPLVGRLGSRHVALESPLLRPEGLDFGLAAIHRARTVGEALDVVNASALPTVNVVAVDAAGSIGWSVGGWFPRRDPGARGVSGGDRQERLPVPELPRVVDPPSGRVVNCNNGNSLLRDAGIAWNTFGGARARRAAALLADGSTREPDHWRLLQDLDAGFYSFYRDLLLDHLGRAGRRAAERTAGLRDEIAAWQGTAGAHERGLPLLVAFREAVRETMFAAVTVPCQKYDAAFTYCYQAHEGPLRAMLTGLGSGLVPPPWSGPVHLVVGHALIAEAAVVRGWDGAGFPTWGEANRLSLTSARSLTETDGQPPLGLDGCLESLQVAQPDFGSSLRLVVRPGALDEGMIAVPGGQSEAVGDSGAALRTWAAGAAAPLVPQEG